MALPIEELEVAVAVLMGRIQLLMEETVATAAPVLSSSVIPTRSEAPQR
jgi:hypothetical protein